MEDLNKYLEFINLKAFCEKFDMNYDFTRQVLQGKRPFTEKFNEKLKSHIKVYQTEQREIFNRIF